MQIITRGIVYELASCDGGPAQTLQFIRKSQTAEGSPELYTFKDGTTVEEVLNVLIEHIKFLDSQFPCRENALVIATLKKSLRLLARRTADRQARNVKGKAAV